MRDARPRRVRFADLGLRLASGIVLAALALFDLWLGGAWLGVLAALAAVLMVWEFYRMVTGDRRRRAPALLALAGASGLSVLATMAAGPGAGGVVILVGLVAAMVMNERGRRLWLAAGLVYMTLSMWFLVLMRDDELRGLPVVVWLVVVVVATDVGAYFVGRICGGPRLWPAVSPGKTWSGAIGGLGFAVAVGVGYGMVSGWGLTSIAFLSGAISIASQLGDLLESAVKRRFAVKDASHLIPGHGGVMDRLDGIMGALWLFALYDLLGGKLGA